MLPTPFQKALVLTGPTGSGKTQLGIELAERLDAEILSMDSMALYRGMDIGTAKPTTEQRKRIAHHLVDVLEPSESGSVAWWLDEAKRLCPKIESRGKQVLIVGGTPLYLKALMCGLFDGPPADVALRQRLAKEAQSHGVAALHQRLAAVDTVCAQRIHPNDLRRIIRALEVFELTGKPMGDWQTQWSGVRNPEAGAVPTVLWLDLPRAELYARIEHRVDEMFAAGFVDEVRQLQARGEAMSLEASRALGYQDVIEMLAGRVAPAETIARVKMRSRNFAKRQITWFRHLPECRPATKELTWELWQTRMKR